MSGSNIKVICRFRPENKIEKAQNAGLCVEFPNDTSVTVNHSRGKNTFHYDRVFDWTASQKDVFELGAKAVIQDVMNGYNGTIFAYGQTGSGKTFTMQGPEIPVSVMQAALEGGDLGDFAGYDPELRGLAPRVVEAIFEAIASAPPTMEFTVSCSYLEIYMERVRDLLDPKKDNLSIHEHPGRGIFVKDLTGIYVASAMESLNVMEIGANNRAVSATNMNAESSRSHAIFSLTITQRNTTTQSSKVGRLYLVDLAGSEAVNKTGAAGQLLQEAKTINKSLTMLGMVINALADKKSTHIPYRDSKLTRILQESLGGNSRTTLIINASPSSYNDAETLSTLRFGARAKTVENKATANVELSPQELRRMLKAARDQLKIITAKLAIADAELAVWRSGGSAAEAEAAAEAAKQAAGDLATASVDGAGAGAAAPPSPPASVLLDSEMSSSSSSGVSPSSSSQTSPLAQEEEEEEEEDEDREQEEAEAEDEPQPDAGDAELFSPFESPPMASTSPELGNMEDEESTAAAVRDSDEVISLRARVAELEQELLEARAAKEADAAAAAAAALDHSAPGSRVSSRPSSPTPEAVVDDSTSTPGHQLSPSPSTAEDLAESASSTSVASAGAGSPPGGRAAAPAGASTSPSMPSLDEISALASASRAAAAAAASADGSQKTQPTDIHELNRYAEELQHIQSRLLEMLLANREQLQREREAHSRRLNRRDQKISALEAHAKKLLSRCETSERRRVYETELYKKAVSQFENRIRHYYVSGEYRRPPKDETGLVSPAASRVARPIRGGGGATPSGTAAGMTTKPLSGQGTSAAGSSAAAGAGSAGSAAGPSGSQPAATSGQQQAELTSAFFANWFETFKENSSVSRAAVAAAAAAAKPPATTAPSRPAPAPPTDAGASLSGPEATH
ncbi:hypothetical protein H696_00619 [Fonticula alba]|uniref:Kinesin-like protein n=1 Tax=Fonticula alba TaxID=691883 RepID=A0A058ZGL3_FONAL|nr:hypothetical protein H696_00619 [Fonticula alba]KCV73073.1 hypothetical protein H696_00619 [Fonticula alba]|eukprot:XP_009492774.1 hypothetical protein H696_00619 [Fonticula alba]